MYIFFKLLKVIIFALLEHNLEFIFSLNNIIIHLMECSSLEVINMCCRTRWKIVLVKFIISHRVSFLRYYYYFLINDCTLLYQWMDKDKSNYWRVCHWLLDLGRSMQSRVSKHNIVCFLIISIKIKYFISVSLFLL